MRGLRVCDKFWQRIWGMPHEGLIMRQPVKAAMLHRTTPNPHLDFAMVKVVGTASLHDCRSFRAVVWRGFADASRLVLISMTCGCMATAWRGQSAGGSQLPSFFAFPIHPRHVRCSTRIRVAWLPTPFLDRSNDHLCSKPQKLSCLTVLPTTSASPLIMFPTVLDASLFRSGSAAERLQFARDLVKAFREDGFVKLHNHGISNNVIKDLFAWVRS